MTSLLQLANQHLTENNAGQQRVLVFLLLTFCDYLPACVLNSCDKVKISAESIRFVQKNSIGRHVTPDIHEHGA